MGTVRDEVAAKLRLLVDRDDPEALFSLEESISSLGAAGAPEAVRLAAFREELALWALAFNAADAKLDPSFDKADVPMMNLSPPPGRPGEPSYPSGVDPRAIPDPRVRAEYEAALEQNRRKAERYRLQHHLRRFASSAASRVEVTLVNEKAVGGGLAEAERYFEAHVVNAARRRELVGLVRMVDGRSDAGK